MRFAFGENGRVVTHALDGTTYEWDIPVSDRAELGDNLFRDINGFFEYIPLDSKLRIDAAYANIAKAFEDILDQSKLAATIIGQVAAIYHEIPLHILSDWINDNQQIIYPPAGTLLLDHDPHDLNPARTYIRRDYIGLVHLTIALRPMLPIWGEYLKRVKDDSGNDYKEYAAFYLLSKTDVMDWEPMERLRLYADALMSADNKKGVAHIMTGLGTEETVEWMVARICARRLTVVNVDASMAGAGNIITNVHGYINNGLRALDRAFGGKIINKRPDDLQPGEDISNIDIYKVKQSVSMGDIETFTVYCENPIRVAGHLDQTIPEGMVLTCLNIAQQLEEMEIYPHHVNLLKWIFRELLPPQAIPCLYKKEMLSMMAVAQAALWHWGFFEIAAMVMATEDTSSNDEAFGLEVRQRFSNETVEKLMRWYPHVDLSDKQRVTDRKQNFAAQAIELLVDEFAVRRWNYHGAPELLNAVASSRGYPLPKAITVPANILELLAQLVIFLAEREEANASTEF